MTPVEPPLPHPRALAHLGDAVYELWVRELALTAHTQVEDLHLFTTKRVKGETQEKVLARIIHRLPDEDLLLAKRAQNMPVAVSRRNNQGTHRKATALEALIGYWYLTQPESLPDRKALILNTLEQVLSENPLL